MTDDRRRMVASMAPEEHEAIDDPHREALARTGFFGEQAAGTVTIAADTGRMLLNLRSEKVEQPGTYGNAGGAHLKDEDPEVAALREHGEETGWQGEILAMIPAFIFRKGDFVYRNFFTVVPCEYDPELGWEADSAVWCTTADLPSPLHFGIEALLADDASREIVEGGWRRHVGGIPYREALPIEWTAGPSPDPVFEGATRPLSPETLRRIAQGVEKWIGGSERVVGLFKATSPGLTPTWEFEVVLPLDEFPDDATIDRLYEAGCDDGIVALRKGVLSISFAREAANLRTAVESAVADVHRAGLSVSRIQVEGLAEAISVMDLAD